MTPLYKNSRGKPRKFHNVPVEVDGIRFWSKVDRRGADECWPWISPARSGSGYGAFAVARKAQGAHRVALALHMGAPIPAGQHVLHSCDNKLCCNPAHLSLGTHSENCKQAYARGLRKPIDLKGEAHPCAKLTADKVQAIRARAASGEPRKALAAEFGFSKSGMDHLIAGRSWAL